MRGVFEYIWFTTPLFLWRKRLKLLLDITPIAKCKISEAVLEWNHIVMGCALDVSRCFPFFWGLISTSGDPKLAESSKWTDKLSDGGGDLVRGCQHQILSTIVHDRSNLRQFSTSDHSLMSKSLIQICDSCASISQLSISPNPVSQSKTWKDAQESLAWTRDLESWHILIFGTEWQLGKLNLWHL